MRIIDEIEHEPGPGAPIAKLVKPSQPADRCFEHAFAALAVHVVFEIAGQRSDNLNLIVGKKVGEILLPDDFKNGEIAAIHDADVHGACGGYQAAKVRIELRSTAGDVKRGDALSRKERQHRADHLPRHLFGAVRAGTDVTVHAGLIAAIADIDLERL